MKNVIMFIIVIFHCFFLVTFLFARSKRVNQIPNGSKFSCTNCHTGYGGARNDFGNQVAGGYLNGTGDVVWAAELAGLDADGDGATNGAELQDPDGTWSVGDPNPGLTNLVTNPGDDASVPTIVIDHPQKGNPSQFDLAPIYPNPFNPVANIQYSIRQREHVSIRIYNHVGQIIGILVDQVQDAGIYTIQWNGFDDQGLQMASGLYFCNMRAGTFEKKMKMVLMR